MTKILGLTIPHAVRISKKWDSRSYYGRIVYGHRGYGAADESFGIFQQRICKEGKITIREKFYEPSDQTQPNKVARQNVFKNCIIAYQNLTTEQKLVYYTRAVGHHYSGYNLFIREYMLSH